jgi:hypothetical protein
MRVKMNEAPNIEEFSTNGISPGVCNYTDFALLFRYSAYSPSFFIDIRD